MAVGLIPHYTVLFSIEGLTKEQFLSLTIEAAEKLEWKISSFNENGFVAFTKFRKRSIHEKIRLIIEDNLVTLQSETQGGQIVDWGRNKKNTENFISAYDQLRTSLSPDELELKVRELNQKLNSGLEENASHGSLGTTENSKGFLSLFVPVKGYFATPIIIELNILVFIIMIASGVNILLPDNESLLRWGANFRPYTLDGQSWRLLTNCFLHIGIIHLLFNMYALLYIGILLEPRLGTWRFTVAYIISGIIGSVTSLYLHANTISAGASGAIFGMYGLFLAMLTTNLIVKSQRKAFMTSIGIFVIYNLVNGMKGGIDNAAHIGGLLSGIALGYSFCPGVKDAKNKKLNYGLPFLLIIVLFVFSSWEIKRIPNDIVTYDNKMKSFSSMESQALEVYRMPENTPKEKLLSEIKERSLYYWNEDKELVTSLDKLDLPDEIHERNKELIVYCDLRIRFTEFLYKSVEEGTHSYDRQLQHYAKSIDSVMKILK
jgi:rhomboid protease GluP